jgi:hypothetical protein
VSLDARLKKLEAARAAAPSHSSSARAVEMSAAVRLMRIQTILIAASQPEASPRLRRFGECLGMFFQEPDRADYWLAEVKKLAPTDDPDEVRRLNELAGRRTA